MSLSPAPYPWCWENYLLEWPKWAAWKPGNSENMWWDEFIPQCYRYDFPAFRATWDQQVNNLREAGAGDRVHDMLAGVLTTGSRPDPVPWPDLEQAVEHVRATGGGGHVWWFSRGVLDEYPEEITAFYNAAAAGHAAQPDRPADWRPGSIELVRRGSDWAARNVPAGRYRVIGRSADQHGWETADAIDHPGGAIRVPGSDRWERAELLVDRRPEMSSYPPAR